MALAAAYKRDYGKRGQIIRAKMDPESGHVEVRQVKIIVDESLIKSEEEIAREEAEHAAREGEPLASSPSRSGRPDGREVARPDEAGRHLPKLSAGIQVEDLGTGQEGPGTLPAEGRQPEEKKEREAEDEVPAEEKKVRFNPEKHLMLEEAQKLKPDVKPGDELEFPLEYHEDYGRIAAQTAKQVIIQRIREAEREAVYDEYKNKEGELVSGLVQRLEGRNVFIDVGRTAAVLPPEEQIPYERYRVGERLKALIILVEKNPRGPGIFLSRSHPRLLRKLFEIEVPEIASGAVEIKAVAREPGSRSKIAVVSHEEGVDPVGSLVGQKGIRVSTVIQELGGEKIDVIGWSEKPEEFIAHALSPAKVLAVDLEEKRKEARAIVPDDQLSLAIGKGGQNVRLAAKVTGWKIDVRSDREKGARVEEETADAGENKEEVKEEK